MLEFENCQAYEEYEKIELLAAERKAIKEFWKDGGWEIEWRVRSVVQYLNLATSLGRLSLMARYHE